jgi:hypothetical protein
LLDKTRDYYLLSILLFLCILGKTYQSISRKKDMVLPCAAVSCRNLLSIVILSQGSFDSEVTVCGLDARDSIRSRG